MLQRGNPKGLAVKSPSGLQNQLAKYAESSILKPLSLTFELVIVVSRNSPRVSSDAVGHFTVNDIPLQETYMETFQDQMALCLFVCSLLGHF